MKIRRLKIMVLGPILLSLPMTCMHSGDGHHSGHGYFSAPHSSYLSSSYQPTADAIIAQKGVTSEKDRNRSQVEIK